MKICKWLIAALVLWSSQITACEICGCSGMGTYFGTQTNPWYYAIGIQHLYRQYQTTHPILFDGESPIHSNEFFHRFQVNAQIPLDSNWIIFTELPFVHLNQIEQGKSSVNSGLGDATAYIQYMVLRPKTTGRYSNRLVVSAGIKLPSGRFQSSPQEVTIPNMQTGSGSFDFLGNLSFVRFGNNWGWSSEMGIKINTSNCDGYQFGNRFNLGFRGFYQYNLEIDEKIQPQIIMRGESAGSDYQGKYAVENSGGSFLLSGLGLGYISGNWNLVGEVSIPLWQNMSNGYVHQLILTQVQLIYQFN